MKKEENRNDGKKKISRTGKLSSLVEKNSNKNQGNIMNFKIEFLKKLVK